MDNRDRDEDFINALLQVAHESPDAMLRFWKEKITRRPETHRYVLRAFFRLLKDMDAGLPGARKAIKSLAAAHRESGGAAIGGPQLQLRADPETGTSIPLRLAKLRLYRAILDLMTGEGAERPPMHADEHGRGILALLAEEEDVRDDAYLALLDFIAKNMPTEWLLFARAACKDGDGFWPPVENAVGRKNLKLFEAFEKAAELHPQVREALREALSDDILQAMRSHKFPADLIEGLVKAAEPPAAEAETSSSPRAKKPRVR